jgi:hypothetical protein
MTYGFTLLISLSLTSGAYGTTDLNLGAYQSSAQPLQYTPEQLQMSSLYQVPTDLQQQLLQLPQAPQRFLQPSSALQLTNIGGSSGLLAGSPQQAFSQHLQSMAGSVPMEQVMNMISSVNLLQKKTAGLQSKLLESQAHEKQLSDVVNSATSQTNTMDQKARKLAHLAQESVSQAQKSIDHEKSVIKDMGAKLELASKERGDLLAQKLQLQNEEDRMQQELSKSQEMLKTEEGEEASEKVQLQQLQEKEAAEKKEWEQEKLQLTQELSKLEQAAGAAAQQELPRVPQPQQEPAQLLQAQQDASATQGIDMASNSLYAAMQRLNAARSIADKDMTNLQETRDVLPRFQLDSNRLAETANADAYRVSQSLDARGTMTSTDSRSLAQTSASASADDGDWVPAALWTQGSPDSAKIASTNDEELKRTGRSFLQIHSS